ncbi:MAG: tRNA (adenosine(37)-N6)-dimethylallyltransferase MiaA [Actinomycetota bacterium]|nr:tRNA (adenosine(37)-N6)-dimethylallyltransferase MiaA [Actinomycetota bacterium]
MSLLVVAVVGPTAAGKSELGVALARALGGEVVNADSMQLYRGMDIGTAKLSLEERQGIPHHLLDVWDVRVTATAAVYQELARGVVADSAVPLVFVGGSGLYLRAALDRLEFPGTDPELRALLEAELEEHGPLPLWERLRSLDPEAATRMEPTNGRRIVRALEVVILTGSMPGEMTSYEAFVPTTYIGIDRPDLRERVAERVERMWAAGLVDEVTGLDGLREGVTASRALGYAQALAQLDGSMTESEAKVATVSATNRFVKRQRAWFGRDPRIHWLDPDRDLLAQALRVIGS